MNKLNFNNFINEIKGKRFVSLGEIHGTKEIPIIIKKIIKNLYNKNFKDIFFEISEKLPDKEFIDSRYTKENQELIDYVKRLIKIKGGNIYFIEPNGEDKDLGMFHIIKNKLKNKSILITGNVHACSKKIKIQDKKIIPCGYYLRKLFGDNIVSVNFIILKGTILNIWPKEIKKKQLPVGIFKSQINWWDYEYRIKEVSPATLLN